MRQQDLTGVLIAGEDEALRAAATSPLRATGYVVQEASSLPEALGILFRSAYPLVVLFDLSCIDLLNVVPSIRRLAQRHAYILVCSSTPGCAPACECLFAQLSMQVLYRPFDRQTLLDAVAHAARSLSATSPMPS